jgi:hypothetical protein
MASSNLTTDELVQATIIPKQEIYYLVTEDNLTGLRQKSILADLFNSLASLCWGAFFSLIITINSIPSVNEINVLRVLQWVFLTVSSIFTVLMICMVCLTNRLIKRLRTGQI